MSKIGTSVQAAALNIPPGTFHGITLIGAVVAAATTFLTLAAALPAWAMFLGWVASIQARRRRAQARRISGHSCSALSSVPRPDC